MNRILAIDPGNQKCGLVLADPEAGLVIEGIVVSSEEVIDMVKYWSNKAPFDHLILGDGTSSKYWRANLSKFAPIQLVDEKGSTLRARKRYWELWPPLNWRRWLPRGLFLPPTNLDAVAALVLLEDYLNKKLIWTGPPKFKIETLR